MVAEWPPRVSSAGEPEAISVPRSMMWIWSARCSASSMWWVVSTTVTPSARSSSSISHVVRRAWGSMPAVGSSTNTSSGRPTSAIARPRRCCWPPESRRYGVRPQSASPSRSTSIGRVERVRVQRGDVLEHLHGAYAAPGAAALQHHADPGEQLARGRAAGRARARGPCRAGPRGSPRRSRASWSCPAPLGPSTAVIEPRATSSDNPSTATLSPYAITSPSISTAGEAGGTARESRSAPRSSGRGCRSPRLAWSP